MKKWVVKIEKKNGRKETRIVPARNKCTAVSNCKNTGDTIVSCEPYIGQNVQPSNQQAENYDYAHGGYLFGSCVGRRKKHGSNNNEH